MQVLEIKSARTFKQVLLNKTVFTELLKPKERLNLALRVLSVAARVGPYKQLLQFAN
jgi:hypothetical protein